MTPLRNWRIAAVALLAAAVITSAGCNLGQSKTPGTNNNGGGSNVSQMGLSSTQLNFGDLAVGHTIQMHLQVTNSSASGSPSITIANVTASGAGFTAKNKLPVDIAPGQTVSLTALFTPPSVGPKSGTLTLDVVGASDPTDVSLSGNGIPDTTTPATAQLSVSPSTLSFGNVAVGSNKNLTGTLTASGNSVVVSSAAWNGQGYALSGITFPVTIQAGSSRSFTVSFAPQAAGSVSGNVSFLSNAPNSPTQANFSGSGTQTAQQHTVALVWQASASTVNGYNVYRGTQSGGPYSRVNSSLRSATNYTDSTVQSGAMYFYVATSVDSNSSESSFSNEVVAVVPQ